MLIERFFVEGLAHASYLLVSDGEAAVVDPKRDVDDYLEAAANHNAKIVAILESHPHADFASGHVELSQRTGATIYVSHLVEAQYAHCGARHGETIRVGNAQITMLETPGHSPDSLSFYAQENDERAVFTGDVLFVGDVGRPDLRDATADPRAMAEALYDSLNEVLFVLPDDTIVYPAHGAGSLCGRKIGGAPSSTIGEEKRENWANRFQNKADFVTAMLDKLPERPAYFSYDVGVNLKGARPLSEVPRPTEIKAQEISRGTQIVDARDAWAYGKAHLPGSLNVGVQSPMFSTWAGFFVKPDVPLVLIVADEAGAQKAWLELARIGFENVVGYVIADENAWREANLNVRVTSQLEPCSLCDWVEDGHAVLDVRGPGEWNQDHLEGAFSLPLPQLLQRLDEVPRGQISVLCGSGYRSSLAASLLELAGVKATNVPGGWSAFAQCDCQEPDAFDVTYPQNELAADY